eukprot:933798-Amphidinium_carterae.1
MELEADGDGLPRPEPHEVEVKKKRGRPKGAAKKKELVAVDASSSALGDKPQDSKPEPAKYVGKDRATKTHLRPCRGCK